MEANNILKFDKKKQISIDNKKIFYKKIFFKIPFKYFFLFLYYLIFKKMILAGEVGVIWSKLRVEYFRSIEYKIYQYKLSKRLLMSKILITGGTGFIGTNLSKILLSKGHNVIVSDYYHQI